jgi:hypothetical protein
MSNFKLKTDDLQFSETKLKSARDVNTIKDKFAFFMQRKDQRNSKEFKDIRDPISKRESIVSNDSANFSFEKTTPTNKHTFRMSSAHKEPMRFSLKQKPNFFLFEENLKSSKQNEVNRIFTNTQSTETLPHSRSFSLTMPFSRFRLSFPQIERNVFEIASCYKTLIEEIDSLKQELQIQSVNLNSISSEETNILNTIKETRDFRNKLIAEKVMLENEIDFHKVNIRLLYLF